MHPLIIDKDTSEFRVQGCLANNIVFGKKMMGSANLSLYELFSIRTWWYCLLKICAYNLLETAVRYPFYICITSHTGSGKQHVVRLCLSWRTVHCLSVTDLTNRPYKTINLFFSISLSFVWPRTTFDLTCRQFGQITWGENRIICFSVIKLFDKCLHNYWITTTQLLNKYWWEYK